MADAPPREEFREQDVTYLAEIDGQIIVIERVPARVSLSTGERLYSPETVERIHSIVRGDAPPSRTVLAPVYAFSSAAGANRPD